jgi:MoaA/NifB/PqqE/SkfB family radical SAM enzyme
MEGKENPFEQPDRRYGRKFQTGITKSTWPDANTMRDEIDDYESHFGEMIRFYIPFTWRFVVLRRPVPLIYGLAITDRCNFNCHGCRVSNTGRPDMSWDLIISRMKNAWSRGFRDIYFSGGEPMLWRDGKRGLPDVISAAKRIGFFHIHLYTNGSLGLDTKADLTWVSIDGLPGIFEKRRGDHFHEVEKAVRVDPHPPVALIYVIDRYTAEGVEPFLRWVRDTRLPVVGVMFYFHTPYYGVDELFLNSDERAPIIDQLIAFVKKGLPIINSRAGLLALKRGNWPRRMPVAYVADIDGEWACCRAPDAACADCGYAACTELTEFQRLKPSALFAMLRYW